MMDWKRALAYISGSVVQELQLRNEELIVHLAKDNRSWGYDRIAGALANGPTRDTKRQFAEVRRSNG